MIFDDRIHVYDIQFMKTEMFIKFSIRSSILYALGGLFYLSNYIVYKKPYLDSLVIYKDQVILLFFPTKLMLSENARFLFLKHDNRSLLSVLHSKYSLTFGTEIKIMKKVESREETTQLSTSLPCHVISLALTGSSTN